MVGIHIQVFAPLHHALEDGHEAFQAFLPETELLKDKSDKYRDSADKLSAVSGGLWESYDNMR